MMIVNLQNDITKFREFYLRATKISFRYLSICLMNGYHKSSLVYKI